MNESKRQELGGRLVDRHIYYGASRLIRGLANVAHEISYKQFENAFGIGQDEFQELFESRDYETTGSAFIWDDADLDQLENIADMCGSWDDVLAEHVPGLLKTYALDGTTSWSFTGSDKDFEDEEDAQQAAIESVLPAIRKAVEALVDDWEWVCREYDLDPEYSEVYEHWIVSEWLARKLKAKGYPTAEVAGLTIWGRGTTGQAISMDEVIQEIAVDLWGGEEA